MTNEVTEKREDQIPQMVKDICDREFEILRHRIKSENSSISEAAIDKTLRLITPIAAALTLIIAVSGYLGYQDIKASAEDLVKQKVNNWFSLDTPSPLVSEELNPLRDRYLIDSVTIRYLRDKAEPHQNYFKLTEKERETLIRIANDKNTSLVDFSDAIEALKAGEPGFSDLVNRMPGDYRGIRFEKVFTEKGFKDQITKQKLILRTYNNDYSLVSIANSILKSESQLLKPEAFQLIANTRQPYAIEYAKKTLAKNDFSIDGFELVKYLAKEAPHSTELLEYIEQNYKNGKYNIHTLGDVLGLYSELIPYKDNWFLFDEDESLLKYKTELAFSLFEGLVDNGVRFRIDNRTETLFSSINEGSYISMDRPSAEEIFENHELLNWLVSKKENDLLWLTRIVDTFDIRNNDEVILAIQLNLAKGTEIELITNKSLNESNVIGPILLKVNETSNELSVVYRNDIGTIISDTVKSVSKLSGSNLTFSFHEDSLYRYSPYNFN
ncbi:hypothetical protein N480_09695 [Pseudoalteromonas luteoviolacea S2607]|uniref:hypothetical protein n=1 Tax=Pseudoalteromonas luteoviolacea TaxID=43657 RepID=UPI0007B03A97|nr:hypothetical protein [Pseudoalteromonas luteoviolacea]KZN29031.1 hypothetical protein N480_09695 [Pseudoalteromonas luteoviolacea S2607]